jgi:hypothetical protein
MLTYLFIIFVIALALAPLGHFFPSKRQREVARMREYAAVHGLFVEFRDLPAADDAPVPLRDVIYYGKRLPNKRANPVASAAWLRSQQGWRSVGRRLPVPAAVQELSPEIIAASVDQSSCGVYWTESAGDAGVEQIRQSLERWCEALIH